MPKYLFFLLLIPATFIISCGDEEEEIDPCDSFIATYDGDVKAIINNSCAYAGCHSGGATAGTGIPVGSNDYTSFASLKPVLDSGRFNARALVARNMPQANSVPAGFPTELSDEELEILTCWRDAGYPES